MSGAWAKACDEHQSPPNLATASLFIAHRLCEIGTEENTPWSLRAIPAAGGAVRAFRKTLPVQGPRCMDVVGTTTEELLWQALRYIAQIQLWCGLDYKSWHIDMTVAEDLRAVEALLRTAWKQEQAR